LNNQGYVSMKLIKRVTTKLAKNSSVMSELDLDLKEAAKLGKEAFKKGIKRVPALDKKLLELISTSKGKLGFSSKLMGAWIKAWDKENLKEKVISKLNLEEMSLADAWDILYKDFVEKTEIVKPKYQLDTTIDKNKLMLLRSIYDNAPIKKLYTYSTNKFGFQIEDLRFDVEHGNLKIKRME